MNHTTRRSRTGVGKLSSKGQVAFPASALYDRVASFPLRDAPFMTGTQPS